MAASAYLAACSLIEKEDDEGDDPTTKGTAGAPPIGKGGGKGEGGSKPTGSGICGLRPDELALKIESEPAEDHTHVVDIPLVNLDKRQPGVFTLQTNKDIMHTHTIRMSGHDVETLVTKGEFTVTSSKEEGHKHDVNIKCPN